MLIYMSLVSNIKPFDSNQAYIHTRKVISLFEISDLMTRISTRRWAYPDYVIIS
jgi:hypothetical protein